MKNFTYAALSMAMALAPIMALAQTPTETETATPQTVMTVTSTNNTTTNFLIANKSITPVGKPKKTSNFTFVNMKCADEEDEGVEATPQSPPLIVDDPGTPGCKTWEINVTFDGDFSKGGSRELEIPLFDINYGIGNNLQLKYEVPIVNLKGDEAAGTGLGNSEFGVKWQFYNNEKTGMGVSFYPQVEFNNPASSSVTRGLAEPGTVVTLPILLSTKVGTVKGADVTMSANGAYNRSLNKNGDTISGAIGLGVPLFNKVALMGEVAAEQSVANNAETGRKDRIIKINIGFKKEITEKVFAYGAIGRSVYSTDGSNHTYAVAGIQLIIPPKHK